jgi:CubicO group peptidase (beta-lactamase class C family)
MKLRRFQPLLAVVLATATAYAEVPVEALDSCVRACMAAWHVPGAAVAVVKDDSVVACEGYGVRRRGEGGRVDKKTVFAIGPASTPFIATAIGLLVKDGVLSWDDTVSRLLPSFRLIDECATQGLTVRDLLSHRTGLASHSGDLLWYGSLNPEDTIFSRLRFLKPDFPPRSRFGYSNLMYLVAGKVASEASGIPWGALVRRRLLDPLGMLRTGTSVKELFKIKNVADPHTVVDGKVTPITYRMLDNMGAAGAMHSSVEDLTRWLFLQLDNGTFNGAALVSPAVIRETRVPHAFVPPEPGSRSLFPATNFNASGLGWMLEDYYGHLLVYNAGGVDGMMCRVGFVPDERLGIAVLTNCDNHRLHDAIFFEVLDGYLGIPPRDWNGILLAKWEAGQREIKSAPVRTMLWLSKPEAFLGSYQSNLYGTANIFRSGKECILHLTAHPGLAGVLWHMHGDTMVSVWRDRYFGKSYPVFSFDASGKAHSFTIRVGEDRVDPLEYLFVRIPQVPKKRPETRATGAAEGLRNDSLNTLRQ